MSFLVSRLGFVVELVAEGGALFVFSAMVGVFAKRVGG